MLRIQDLASARARRMYASGDLRAYLLSDLVRRVLERHKVRMVVYQDALCPDAGALNLRPPEHVGPPPAVDVTIGSVSFDEPIIPVREIVDAGLDPLAVRLVFLEHHYRDPLVLDWDALRDAHQALVLWRTQVARWAESASKPMHDGYVRRAEAAFDDDLHTPTALRALRELEQDASVEPGSKFESFLHLDHVLALDLSVDIGRN
ncbi:hypothetical protein ACIBG8_47505 [Nonomuraea sp. NPDC050556]|uniref:hypothetical protein n=1 Tax=Nonomuraea sp. NPDC050556 TaxID=3364369 RepID=UPI0037B6DDCD